MAGSQALPCATSPGPTTRTRTRASILWSGLAIAVTTAVGCRSTDRVQPRRSRPQPRWPGSATCGLSRN